MDDFGRCVIRTGDEFLSADSRPQFRAFKRRIDDAMHGLLSAAIEDGSLASLDVKMTAFALAGALNWPARWYVVAGKQSAEQVAEGLVDVLMQGLIPRDARPGLGRLAPA